MQLWQDEKHWRSVGAFDKDADHLASQPEGMLVLVDSATGEQRPVFIEEWDVERHAGQPLILRLKLKIMRDRDAPQPIHRQVYAACACDPENKVVCGNHYNPNPMST